MTIERLFISPAAEGPQVEVTAICVVAGRGIEGDRYFDRCKHPGQNITLVEAEEIEAFIDANGREHDLSITRRNLVTRGVRLNALVGHEFRVGDVRLRGVELCEPCRSLGKALASAQLEPAAVIAQWLHRGGLRADVLSTGIIERGASLHLPEIEKS